MRILQLSNKSPYPPSEGGPMAMYAVWQGLTRAGHRVDILTMDTPKFHSKRIPEGELGDNLFEAIHVDSRIKPLAALINLFSRSSYHASRFYSHEYKQRLLSLVKEESYDIVQLEGIFPALYLSEIRKHSKAPVILRAHNIEHLIWERVRGNTNNPVYKAYLGEQVRRLKKWEESVWNEVDGIIAITEVDAEWIRQKTERPVTGLPFGIDIPEKAPDFTPGHPVKLFHIGSMDWMPNQEGMQWFLRECIPEIRKQHPEIMLRLAGRHFPAWLRDLNEENVEIIGEVEHADEFVAENDILVVPLLSGSGMRIKIIEAMAAGKVVISTSLGAEGIEAADDRNILIADTAGQFSEQINRCVSDLGLLERVGRAAFELVCESYSQEAVSRRFMEFYTRILQTA